MLKSHRYNNYDTFGQSNLSSRASNVQRRGGVVSGGGETTRTFDRMEESGMQFFGERKMGASTNLRVHTHIYIYTKKKDEGR